MTSNKVNNNIRFYHFYKILSKYSHIDPHYEISKENKEHHTILSVKEIREKMLEAINYDISRRTIYKYMEDLEEIGLEVSKFEDNEMGYALITKELESY